ncbi:MAG TPA: hypothetical protein VMH23_12705 [Bacteroidota bacterium]|nr:hypothetical protein [Bacteroidota bacterium]
MMRRTMLILGLLLLALGISLARQAHDEAESTILAVSPASFTMAQCFVAPGSLKTSYVQESPEHRDGPVGAANIFHQSKLLGGWSGLRNLHSENGVDLSFSYKGDNFADVSGGLQRGMAYMQMLDAALSVDAEKLAGWRGGSLLVRFISDNGVRP